MRRESIVRQCFPVGQQVTAQRLFVATAEPRDFCQQALCITGVGNHNGEHALLRFQFNRSLRKHEGVGRTMYGRQNETGACFGKILFRIEGHQIAA